MPKLLKRLIIISFFLGINIVLGRHFLSQDNVFFAPEVAELAAQFGWNLPTPPPVRTSAIPTVQLEKQVILELVNATRNSVEVAELTPNQKLELASERLIEEFAQLDYNIGNRSFDATIKEILEEVGYSYSQVSDVAIVGVMTSREAFDTWMTTENQKTFLLDETYTETGIATATTKIEGQTVGVVVQVLAKPYAPRPAATPIARTPIEKPVIRSIPDSEVVAALNTYRTSHQVHQLVEDQHLCQYAEKRAADLAKIPGLDNHEGFRADFADLNNLPVGIRDYSGGQVGENLASQFCVNATTKEPFIAQTGTALVEWCFDSSSSGHREAQLNPRYNAVCARHSGPYYVIIFGE